MEYAYANVEPAPEAEPPRVESLQRIKRAEETRPKVQRYLSDLQAQRQQPKAPPLSGTNGHQKPLT